MKFSENNTPNDEIEGDKVENTCPDCKWDDLEIKERELIYTLDSYAGKGSQHLFERYNKVMQRWRNEEGD